MSNAYEQEVRAALFEAFTAGWQAGLAVTITNPRVLAVVESCFDLWLLEAADEVEVLGLPFRRADLPVPPRPADRPGRSVVAVAAPRIPAQRRSPDDSGAAPVAPGGRSPAAGGRDLRRLLARSVGKVGGRHRHAGTGD